jgi:hypothetical protein
LGERRIGLASRSIFERGPAMANFTTHIAVGTVASGMMATLVMAANVVSPEELLTLAAAGALGSVLPDVDLKDSRPSQAMFSLLAVFVAFVVLFHIGWKYSIAEMWILWAGTFLAARYIGGNIFHSLSYHRGIYHSVLAGVFFAFLTAAVYRHILGTTETVAWLGGLFMLIGYMVHLVLDEIYSVDVMDARVKASFGTALKLIDHKHLGHSAAMATAAVLAFLATPPLRGSFEAVATREIAQGLHDRLLPKDKWFGFIPDKWRPMNLMPARAPAAASDITTGSIPRPEAVPEKAASKPAK